MKVLNKLMKSKLLLPVCGVLLVAGCSDSSPPPTDADTAAPAAVAPAQGKGPGAAQTAQRQPGAPIQPPGISEPKVEEPVTAVFNCGSGGDAFAMVTRTVPEDVPPTISLFLPPDRGAEVYQRLDAERAGEVYANEEIRLVLSGQTASIIIDDKTYTRCEYDHAASLWEEAKLSGVDFRGMGNEPGWVIEIRDGFRYDYGSGSVSLPISDRTTDPATAQTLYVAADERSKLEVTLNGGECVDSMSGETFATSVQVKLAQRTFEGCGRALH
jgi:hypothetical protein